ncbi:MAG: histidine kinase [Coriobacteriales bacterium]|nr:histidine kinase [Coriobacteriales bacterium]
MVFSQYGNLMSAEDSIDRLRANQTKQILSLASKTLEYMRGGLSVDNCQAVCKLLLPETPAMAIAMTDNQNVLGYAGTYADMFPVGHPIRTAATHRVLASQQPEVFLTAQEPALEPMQQHIVIPAGIVIPLIVRKRSVGALKLYYKSPASIDETQCAIAEGFGDLLSTQLGMSELDHQVELATKAELQALQSQINPHFLFNTINTIASLIRTNPSHARELLREFAVFYRQTLENSNDLIPLSRELEQTRRYMLFEIARFGEDRIVANRNIEPGLEEIKVPAFIVQPVVENSINHGMRPNAPLHLDINIISDKEDVIITVHDDGCGMTQEVAHDLLAIASASRKGTGIALRNVNARLKACFDPQSGVTIESEPGVGTVVRLLLCGALRTSHSPQI